MAGKPVVVKFAGDTSGLERSLGQINQKLGGFGSTLAKIGGAVAGAFAVSKVTDFLGGAVAAARESNAIAAQTEATLKSTGGAAKVTADEIGNLANSIALKTGVDDEAIQSGENLLLTFTNVRNEAGKGNDIFNQATRTITDMSVALGQDTKSSAIQLGKALNDPIKGITALSRVGVSFTQQQKDQVKAMVEAGDTMGAQKLILSELNKEFGGSAEAQSTAAGRLGVAWGNIQEQIGNALIPIIDKLASWLSEKLPAAIAFLQDKWRTLSLGVSALVAAFKDGDVTSDGFVGAMERIGVKLRELWDGAKPFIDWIGQHWQPILIGLGAAFIAITSPITAVVAALVILYTRFQVVRDIVQGVADFFTNVLIPAVSQVVGAISDQFSTLVAAVQERWDAISEAIGHVVVVVQAVIDGFITYVQTAWELFGDNILSIAKVVWDQIQNVVDTAIRIIRDVIDAVMALINGDFGDAWDAIKDIPAAAFDYIRETIVNALKVIGEVVQAGWDYVKYVFGLAWDGMKSLAGNAVDGIVGFFQGLPGRIAGLAESIGGAALNIGQTIIGKLAEGVKGSVSVALDFAGAVAGAVKNVMNSIIRRLNDAFDFTIKGPGPLPDLHVNLPDIPQFDSGGVVPGRFGSPQLVMAHAGETILPTHRQSVGLSDDRIVSVLLRIEALLAADGTAVAASMVRSAIRSA